MDNCHCVKQVGPGTHEHKEGTGTQVMSKNVTAPAYHFSRGLREKGDRQYVPGFEREMCAKYTPGPGAHQVKDSIETGAPNRTKVPAYSFHPEHFTGKPKEKDTCGPGRYETDSAIGSQATSKRRNQPSFRFGAVSVFAFCLCFLCFVLCWDTQQIGE